MCGVLYFIDDFRIAVLQVASSVEFVRMGSMIEWWNRLTSKTASAPRLVRRSKLRGDAVVTTLNPEILASWIA